jgi:hypothetical protein
MIARPEVAPQPASLRALRRAAAASPAHRAPIRASAGSGNSPRSAHRR